MAKSTPSTPLLKSPPVTRTTAFSKLPEWLSRREVRQYVGISLASAVSANTSEFQNISLRRNPTQRTRRLAAS